PFSVLVNSQLRRGFRTSIPRGSTLYSQRRFRTPSGVSPRTQPPHSNAIRSHRQRERCSGTRHLTLVERSLTASKLILPRCHCKRFSGPKGLGRSGAVLSMDSCGTDLGQSPVENLAIPSISRKMVLAGSWLAAASEKRGSENIKCL